MLLYFLVITVTSKVILTAAHCFVGQFSNAATIIARLGRRNAFLQSNQDTYYSADYPVSAVVPHESYNSNTNENDIALVILYNNIAWNRGISPICLPKLNEV